MYSFDVFDTLITRTTATPQGIFALMQKELCNSSKYEGITTFLKHNFYQLRIHAEAMAHQYFQTDGIEDITLEHIYIAMAMNGSLSLQNKKLLMELERFTEYQNSLGIIENIDRVKVLIEQGKQIVLITDMYLDKRTIKSMLVKADSIFETIPLYVSSEYQKGKWSGNLYKIIKDREGVEYSNWIHTGDNQRIDIQAAKSLEIKTVFFQYESLTPYERELLYQKEDDPYIQLTIGTARNTRLLKQLSGAGAIGCSIGGVILFPYIWWLLQESIRYGIHRLYFIARDGYILKEIADIIIRKQNYKIATHYIYGSRRAWRVASLNENSEFERILYGSYLNNVSSIKDLADVFEITEEDLYLLYPKFKNISDKDMKSPAAISYIIRILISDKKRFIAFLSDIQKDKRELATAYLQQEVDYSMDDFAFVELAGSGITQGCLANMMYEVYKKPIRTFFFKLDCIKVPDYCIFYDFFPSYLYLHLVIETLARAPQGQTIGYKRIEEKIVPEFIEVEVGAFLNHGYKEYIEGVKSFTELYISLLDREAMQYDNLDVIVNYMDYITRRPNKEVADFIGDMPNIVTGREKKLIEFAPILSNKAIRSLYLLRTGEKIETYYQGTALEYSILRSGKKVAKKIEFYKKHYNKLYGKFVRFPKTCLQKIWKKDTSVLYPFNKLQGKIVIYGAGVFGKKVYNEMRQRRKCKVVQWVDKNYMDLNKHGFPVTSPEAIGTISFDYILIAVVNAEQAEDIKQMLLRKQISYDKIM